jgi:hypothetical protein
MAINKGDQPNIDKSNLPAYPNGQIQDNDGTDNGTPVARVVFSDIFEFFDKLMRLAGLGYSGTFDNEQNGYQLIKALMNFAGKNDYIQELGSSAGVLTLPVKIETLGIGEVLIAKASVDKGAETTIQGTTPAITKVVAVSSSYKSNDYVLIVNGDAVITIVRLATADNLDVLVGALNYLKAATQDQENAGVIDNVATTPLKNKIVFTRRVIGDDSNLYKASADHNGLMSKEDFTKLAGLTNVRNRGWFSGADPGEPVSSSSKPVSGNITSVIVQASSSGVTSTYLVTMANPMDNVNYFVRNALESQGTESADRNMLAPVFIPVNTTQFKFIMQTPAPGTESIKVHLEAIQL